MSTVTLLPGAAWRPVSYRGEAHPFPHAVLGWVEHVVVGNGSPFHTFEDAHAPHRRFSHGWVAKDGHGEQYQSLDRQSWAQVGGNPLYLAFETEGFPDEPLTAAQINTLARWHNAVGAIDAIAHHPGERGIGTHFMGGAGWGGHSCPDPVGREGKGPRSLQRQAILNRAKVLRNPAPEHPVAPPEHHHQRFTLHRTLRYVPGHELMHGPDVEAVQHHVGAHADGKYGPDTRHAVFVWQGLHHLIRDGEVGPQTAGSFGWLFV